MKFNFQIDGELKTFMKILNYVKRCKRTVGFELYERLHAADNNQTFCGKALNCMWFVVSNDGLDEKAVTCPKCRRALADD